MGYYGKGTDNIRFVPISHAAECRLFKCYYASRPNKKGDISAKALAARDEIIANHLALVAKISLLTAKNQLPEDEAISTGNMMLMKILHKRSFRTYRRIRFSTYIVKFIQSAIFRAVQERDTLGRNLWVSPPTNHPQTFDEDEIFTPKKVNPADLSDGDFEELLAERDLSACRRTEIRKILPRLKGLERQTIEKFGLDGLGFTEIAKELGISRQAVQQAFLKAAAFIRRSRYHKLRELI